jgi:molybdopterin synthase catalytic subunit
MNDHARPSLDAWLQEFKADPAAADVGMFLSHNGVVRSFSRDGREVTGMDLSYDEAGLAAALDAARTLPGITFVRAWVNSGHLEVGDDIMYVLVGGDIREHVFDALQSLVRTIKTTVVAETELRD